MEEHDIGWAVRSMRQGRLVARAGWNGKGMYVFYNPGSEITVSEGRPMAFAIKVGTQVQMLPYIMMKTATGGCVPWLASQTDLLADDWEVVELPA